MCFLFGIYRPEQRQFVCGFNRNEYYDRPWEPTRYHPDKKVTSGVDLKSGGTWLAIDDDLNFCAVTNVRLSDDRKTQVSNRSRGHLCQDFFDSKQSAKIWVASLEDRLDPNYYT